MTPGLAGGAADRGQLPVLTSLRFFAALWVLGHHAMPRAVGWTSWNAFWDVGWLGVTFFFVLSGFILTYTYAGAAKAVAARVFWAARFARIVPVYAAAMLFAIPEFVHNVTHPAVGQAPAAAADVTGAAVASVLMLQAWFPAYACLWNCPSWSLSAEFFFYALFPWVVPLAMMRGGRAILFVGTLAAVIFVGAGFAGLTVSPLALAAAGATLNPLARLPEFVAGVWLGGVFLTRRDAAGRERARWPWSWLGVTAGALGVVAIAITGRPVFGPALHLWSLPLFALLVYSSATMRRGRGGPLELSALVMLGNASYALYMTHGPLHGYVLAAVNRVAPGTPRAWVFAGYLCAAIALAVGSYIILERPARAWMRRRLVPA